MVHGFGNVFVINFKTIPLSLIFVLRNFIQFSINIILETLISVEIFFGEKLVDF